MIARMLEPTFTGAAAGDLQQAQFAKLVARMAGGDESALAQLYDATLSRVYAIAIRICRDPGVAEDVTSEV